MYLSGCIDFLLAISVQSEIIGKNSQLVHLYLAFIMAISLKLEQIYKYTNTACQVQVKSKLFVWTSAELQAIFIFFIVSVCSITYRMHVELHCGCSILNCSGNWRSVW